MESSSPIFRAGSFDVLKPAARGGMARVWFGRHRLHGTEAAIKVLPAGADDASLRRRLRAEVRALAGLDHPRVASVLDTGTIDARAEAASEGEVRAASPWLAMTWLPEGDLWRLPLPQPWPVVRALLLDVLEALAHAHARGVIHRDIKPGNILLRAEGDGVRAVLTDFGIAQVLDGAGEQTETRIVGTPAYMAPEQIRGRWRDVGPWTDLYALGCVAWHLATGAPPFVAERLIEVTSKHLFEAPPALGPGVAPPFAEWLRRLLRKDPTRRFDRAADAAAALSACGPADDGPRAVREALRAAPRPAEAVPAEEQTAPQPGHHRPSDVGQDTTVDGALSAPTGWTVPAVSASIAGDRHGPSAPPAPVDLPEDWRGSGAPRGVVGRIGTGLFGLRTLPMVGHMRARDRLWRTLREVWAGRQPRLCLVTSPGRFERDRLADWLTRRAHELGAASVLHATHGPIPARGDGIAAAVLRMLRAVDAPDGLLRARIDHELGRWAPDAEADERQTTADALFDLARRGVVERGGRQDAVVDALTRWLGWRGRRRPVVLRLDDAHWSVASLDIAGRLLARPELPLTVLITCPPLDACGEIGAERRATLEQLRGETRPMHLDPLPEETLRTMLVDGVGLDPALAERLAEAADGDTLFAVQTVAEWLADDALRPGCEGLAPMGDRATPIPADRIALGEARLTRAVARSGVEHPIARRALEAAAVLGMAVPDVDWQAVSGCPASALKALADALLDLGLARRADGGWSFTHRFTRDALLDRLRAEGRAAALARRCAAIVADPDPTDPRPAERRARYLALGGQPDAALDAWLVAARRAVTGGSYRAGAALLDSAEAALADAGPDDARRGRLLAIRAEAARFSGRAEQATAALDALRALPRPPDAPWPRAEMKRLDGQAAFFAGRMDAAHGLWTEARALFEQADDPDGVARSLHGLGWALGSRGRVTTALACFGEGRAVAEGAGIELGVAWATEGLAAMRAWTGHPDGAALAMQGLERFARLGQVAGQTLCRVHLADALWDTGALDRVRDVLDRALMLLRPTRSSLMGDVLTHRALCALAMGRYAAARVDAAEVEQAWMDGFATGHRCGPLAILAEVEHHSGRPERARRCFDRAVELAEQSLFFGPDKGRMFERLATCLVVTDRPRARKALALAHRIWAALRPERAAAIAERQAMLGRG